MSQIIIIYAKAQYRCMEKRKDPVIKKIEEKQNLSN